MKGEWKSSVKVVIAGAGFAGASTAWWLRHLGETDVVILERGEAPGLQASGQNAGMARQSTPDPVLTRLCAEGVRFMSAPPKEFRAARPILRRAGSILIGSKSQVDKLSHGLQNILSSTEFETCTADRLGDIPYHTGSSAEALYTRSDGYIDLAALLNGFLSETVVHTRCELKSAVRETEGWRLATTEGQIRCSMLVLAAGAWSRPLSAAMGGSPQPLNPTTRHLFQTDRRAEFSRESPFVWDMRTECYTRPDGDGHLLLSACDQDPYNPQTPLLPDAGQSTLLRKKLSTTFPKLARIPFRRYWCGTRVLTPDGRFILGPDPGAENLFWAAGLGGHGVTAAPAVGRIVAESILGLKPVPAELSAGRFTR